LYKKRLILIGCASAVLLSFSGCSNFSKNKEVLRVDSDPVSERIAEASNAASLSLKVLARVNNAKSRRILSNAQISQDAWQNSNIPPKLEKKVDIDMWTGPAETVLRNLSKASGYRFRVTGSPSIPEIIISISGKDKMIIDYLYDIGYQLGDRADVIIHPLKGKVNGIIDLTYLYKLN